VEIRKRGADRESGCYGRCYENDRRRRAADLKSAGGLTRQFVERQHLGRQRAPELEGGPT